MDVGKSFEEVNHKKNDLIDLQSIKYSNMSVEAMKFSVRGTIPWMSPELTNAMKTKQNLVFCDPYRSDMFSVGIILIQLCYLNIEVNSHNHTHKQLLEKAKQIKTKGYTKDLSEMILRLIDIIPSKRPDFKTLQKEF